MSREFIVVILDDNPNQFPIQKVLVPYIIPTAFAEINKGLPSEFKITVVVKLVAKGSLILGEPEYCDLLICDWQLQDADEADFQLGTQVIDALFKRNLKPIVVLWTANVADCRAELQDKYHGLLPLERVLGKGDLTINVIISLVQSTSRFVRLLNEIEDARRATELARHEAELAAQQMALSLTAPKPRRAVSLPLTPTSDSGLFIRSTARARSSSSESSPLGRSASCKPTLSAQDPPAVPPRFVNSRGS